MVKPPPAVLPLQRPKDLVSMVEVRRKQPPRPILVAGRHSSCFGGHRHVARGHQTAEFKPPLPILESGKRVVFC